MYLYMYLDVRVLLYILIAGMHMLGAVMYKTVSRKSTLCVMQCVLGRELYIDASELYILVENCAELVQRCTYYEQIYIYLVLNSRSLVHGTYLMLNCIY